MEAAPTSEKSRDVGVDAVLQSLDHFSGELSVR